MPFMFPSAPALPISLPILVHSQFNFRFVQPVCRKYLVIMMLLPLLRPITTHATARFPPMFFVVWWIPAHLLTPISPWLPFCLSLQFSKRKTGIIKKVLAPLPTSHGPRHCLIPPHAHVSEPLTATHVGCGARQPHRRQRAACGHVRDRQCLRLQHPKPALCPRHVI